jgi:hypothetical protein
MATKVPVATKVSMATKVPMTTKSTIGTKSTNRTKFNPRGFGFICNMGLFLLTLYLRKFANSWRCFFFQIIRTIFFPELVSITFETKYQFKTNIA